MYSVNSVTMATAGMVDILQREIEYYKDTSETMRDPTDREKTPGIMQRKEDKKSEFSQEDGNQRIRRSNRVHKPTQKNG